MGPGVTFRKGYGWAPVFQIVVAGTRERGLTQISKPGGPPPLPDVLNALLAFAAEHQRCGDLDGGRDNALVWLTCSCGAQVAHPASASHPATAEGASRK